MEGAGTFKRIFVLEGRTSVRQTIGQLLYFPMIFFTFGIIIGKLNRPSFIRDNTCFLVRLCSLPPFLIIKTHADLLFYFAVCSHKQAVTESSTKRKMKEKLPLKITRSSHSISYKGFILCCSYFRNCLLASGRERWHIIDVRLLCLLLCQSVIPELRFNGPPQ